MDYELISNTLCASDFIRLRESAGWSKPHTAQIEAGLRNSLFTVAAVYRGQVIGMGRLVGDGFTICYIQDLIVLPEYQGKGIGTAIMNALITYIRDHAISETCVTMGLFATKGNEAFYEPFGFCVRPNDRKGAGMEMSIKAKEHKHE